MNTNPTNALQLLKTLLQAQLVQNDAAQACACLAQQLHWLGTENEEKTLNPQTALAALLQETAPVARPLTLNYSGEQAFDMGSGTA